MQLVEFDYQSNRHCAKTSHSSLVTSESLITSQIDTAPKLELADEREDVGLITSQIDTAPKLPPMRYQASSV